MFGYFMPITTATKCHQHNLQTWVINFHQGEGISAAFFSLKFVEVGARLIVKVSQSKNMDLGQVFENSYLK